MTYTQLFRDRTGTVKAVVLHGLDKARGGIWRKPQEMSREPRSLARRGFFPLTVRSFCLLLPWLRPRPALPSCRKPSGCQVSSPELGRQALPVPRQEPLSRARLGAHRDQEPLCLAPHLCSPEAESWQRPNSEAQATMGRGLWLGRVTPRCLMPQTAPLGALPLLLPAFASD